MFTLKLLLAVIFSLQVSVYVLAQNNLTDNAQKALDLLSNQIEQAITVVTSEAPNVYFRYFRDSSAVFGDDLQTNTNNVRYIIGNLSNIAVNVVSGRDCIQLVLNSSGYAEGIFTYDELIVENLLVLAQADISNVLDEYTDLNNEFVANCVQNKRNCNGTSRAIIAEVERILPSVLRIPFELLTELHIVGYKFTIDVENAHTELMESYNKAVQNTTLCIAAKIAEHEQDSGLPVPSGSVFYLYEELISTIASATAASVNTLVFRDSEVISQTFIDYLDYINRINTVSSRANNTINSLIETAEVYNVKVNCTIPDLPQTANPSIERLLNEYLMLVNDTLARQHRRGVQDVSNIGDEIDSIALEIENCAADAPCDYLAEKIASKISEIPWQMQQVTNTTVILLQQSVTAVRESGARVVRDLEEQLEVGLIDLKSCIQSSL